MNGIRLVPLGINKFTVDATTAKGLGAGLTNNAIPAGATVALIVTETQALRWRDDGTDPTSTIGVPLATGLLPFEYWANVAAMKVIGQSASATVTVAFYRIAG